MKHLLSLDTWNKEEILETIEFAEKIKKNPRDYNVKMKDKTLLMLFEKASLRTRISFEVGMTQLGGHAIYFNIATSPMGKGESIQDTARNISRYVDIIMARIKQKQLEEIAKNSTIPVINGMTEFAHPCQILGDFLTIKEKKGKLEGLKIAFVGDGNNNITHSLLYACPQVGIELSVATPKGEKFEPQKKVIEKAKEFASTSGSEIRIGHDPKEAVKNADIVVADTWVSYYVPPEEKEKRKKILGPYQVNAELMALAKPDANFMHCLPAVRGMEMTADVIDGKQSIVFDQAENRLHIQKAIMLRLLDIK